ncbi:MAG: hypothetical protein HGA54_02295 [Actinobacteria bacterium]|nr:hypothetical protein [Actinomycetota bacterium]
MANGYIGKILTIDLTTQEVGEIETAKYESWGGGEGMAAAIYWDLAEDKTLTDGTDPRNIIQIMTSPLTGTFAPSAGGRVRVSYVGLWGWPVGYLTGSLIGGRLGSMIKFAGWDGVVITGKSETPVWINVIQDKVTFENATDLWDLDTWETQEFIWSDVMERELGEWNYLGTGRDDGRTTQRPAIITTGPSAEKYGPWSALIHDAGQAAGQGGSGGVFASKNLKALSIYGTGGVEIADPTGLMEARQWVRGFSASGNLDDLKTTAMSVPMGSSQGVAAVGYPEGMKARVHGCSGCIRNCKGRTERKMGNESRCLDFLWYSSFDMAAHKGAKTDAVLVGCDQVQRLGINSYPMMSTVLWLKALYENGILGVGKQIESSLPYDLIGEEEFAVALTEAIAYNLDIGADLALGLWQCATKWGRLEEDVASGWLPLQASGYVHHYDARHETEWGWGNLFQERDHNMHDFNYFVFWAPTIWGLMGMEPEVSAERMAEIISSKMVPFNDDPNLIDHSDEGIYSDSMIKLVRWHTYYQKYYKESLVFCDYTYADFINPYGENMEGVTPKAEEWLTEAVTAKGEKFEDGIALGRKIYNLERAIWTLQGRHRDTEVYGEYNYNPSAAPFGLATYEAPYTVPMRIDGEWVYKSTNSRSLDKVKVEDFKTRYYAAEGWDETNGWPTRATLEELGLDYIADELESYGKLGA